MQFPVAPLTSLVCLFVSEVPVYCNECNKVFELVVSQQACPQCRFSVLSASKVLNDDGYIVQRPAAAEAWKKCLIKLRVRKGVCATALKFLWWRPGARSSFGDAPAQKFLGWHSGAQVPWVALRRSQFLGWRAQFLGWRSGAKVPWVALRRSRSLSAPALKFLGWRSGAQVPWVALRRSSSLGGAPALKFLGWRSCARSSLGGALALKFLWWRSGAECSLGGAPALNVPWVALRRSIIGRRSGAQ